MAHEKDQRISIPANDDEGRAIGVLAESVVVTEIPVKDARICLSTGLIECLKIAQLDAPRLIEKIKQLLAEERDYWWKRGQWQGWESSADLVADEIEHSHPSHDKGTLGAICEQHIRADQNVIPLEKRTIDLATGARLEEVPPHEPGKGRHD